MKLFSYILTIICLLPIKGGAQTYKSLWNQVEEARGKDLPRNELEKLDLIIEKARVEKQYGHLLKASLRHIQVSCVITPDTIYSEVEKLEKMEQEAREKDPVLAAVWNTVLGSVYRENHQLGKSNMADSCFVAALANPDLLAKHKVSEYKEIIENGYDGKWFNNDLLSVIGYQAKKYSILHKYYSNTSCKTAACLTACELVRAGRDMDDKYLLWSERLPVIDSLITLYGDTKVGGELAVLRYNVLEGQSSVTLEERVKFIDYAVDKWRNWPRINILRNEKNRLTQPFFSVSMGSRFNVPSQPRLVKDFNVRNIEEVTMTVTRLSLDASRDYNLNKKEDLALLKGAMTDKQWVLTRQYKGLPAYESKKDSLELPGLPVGMYLVELSTNNKKIPVSRALYYVSDVQVIALGLPQNTTRYAVVSATTGQPLAGAKLRIQTYDSKKNGENKTETYNLNCDENGEALFVINNLTERVQRVFAYTEDDKYCPEENLYGYFQSNSNQRPHDVVEVYTDRSIYRPGQKVQVGIITYRHDGNLTTVAKETQINVELRDANGKVVEKKNTTTDAFGKGSVEFDLPENGLTGVFSLSASNGHTTFRVEQYKRPTYEVTFPEIHEAYKAGDTVTVKGHATTYSGVPVQGAKVKYTVKRRNAWWWGYRGNSGETLLEGETTTDSEGAFDVAMPMLLPDGASKSYAFYNITAVADVTDNGGESHAAEITLPLGSRATVLACNMPSKIERDSLKTLRFDYKNMAGADLDAEVTYYVDDAAHTYTARTNTEVPVGFDTKALGSGKHRLTAVCGQDTVRCDFVMFSLDDKVPCEKTSDWFYATDKAFPSDGSPVVVQIGSSDPDTHVLYNVISGHNVLESGCLELNNSIFTRVFNYDESYGNGILVTYAWVKNGRTYTHEVALSRPLPDRKLHMEWATFRDKLVPGQKEQWTLKVTRPDGSPASAQVMATMYDKSLDQIYGHDWHFAPVFYLPLPATNWSMMRHSGFSFSESEFYEELKEPSLVFNSFLANLFSMDSYYLVQYGSPVLKYDEIRVGPMRRLGAVASAPVNTSMMKEASEEVIVVGYAKEEEAAAEADAVDEAELSAAKNETVSLRENLNETAFFMPALTADSKGNVVMRFTLPESVTTWKVMALATDKEMNSGRITAETVAQKDVMVQPNMPRFLRENDKATISARIFNNTERSVSGKAVLTLLDPETEKTVYTQTKDYQLAPKQGGSVTFDVQPDGKISVYVCRVTVSGKGYSDGEQHYLPVMPDHEMVIRTYPFTQHEPGRMAIKLDKLFDEGVKDGKLTVEYTNNPAWLVVQTMPSLAAPVSDDVISQTSAFYANTIGRHLLSLSPAIRENIQAWQKEVGDETSLNSPLQKNQELKDLVLSETPWVRIAERESSQRRDLALYFDESLLNSRLQSELYKIRKLQNGDGSWSWWPGMTGSPYMTTSVTQTLVRLNHLVGKQQNTASMVSSAFGFLGNYLVKEMKAKKEEHKKNKDIVVRPSETAIQIMYTFALDGRQLTDSVQKAQKYFIDLLRDKATDLTIYGKATTAVIFAANKEKKLADEFVESISQYSVMTEEAGRYFDTRRAYYSWCDYKIPTEVAAIEAFKAVRPDDTQTVEEMRRWLLHEKRGVMWKTPIHTVDAAYAFLDGNLKALDNGEPTRFTLDGKYIPTEQGTSGIGYVKTSVEANGKQAFAAEKTSTGTSWGALYAQFEQKSTEVEAAASEITVTREVIDKPEQLEVGKKIKVRITVTANRDLDFVQVVDRRAACMEPLNQLSGYAHGYYCAPQDNQTCYYFDRMPKGKHVIETEYYIDRVGTYVTGTCKAQCAYAPEYVGTAPAFTLVVR